MEHKARGLCFQCGKHYHPLHQCEKKHSSVVILGDDEAINEAGEIIVIELKEGDEEITPTCNSLGPFGLKDKKQSSRIFPQPLTP